MIPSALLAGAKRLESAANAQSERCTSRAYYNITKDHVTLPPFETFIAPLAYYATLSHEITHWSGAERRLARGITGDEKTDAYALDELVAELGAVFCALVLSFRQSRETTTPDTWRVGCER